MKVCDVLRITLDLTLFVCISGKYLHDMTVFGFLVFFFAIDIFPIQGSLVHDFDLSRVLFNRQLT